MSFNYKVEQFLECCHCYVLERSLLDKRYEWQRFKMFAFESYAIALAKSAKR
ncbi:hypothetical protein [Microseira wollei]|uniref:hypothetical protein n=1 Tax=Microseira wollei TaxID=467598 RepID=UPI001CFEF6DE|nr:hypothetical protein [Microseira wollei]